MSVKCTYVTRIRVPLAGTYWLGVYRNMNWKRTLIERLAALLALFGVMVMVTMFAQEIEGSPIVVGVLGVVAMLSVLLIYGVPFARISVSRDRLDLEFEDEK